MPDPLERLADLADPGGTPSPLPATEVRRRGDRLRRRRHRLGAAGAALAVAVVASGGLVAARQVTGTTDRPGLAATPTAPTPTAPTPTAPTLTAPTPTASVAPVNLAVGLPPAEDRVVSTDVATPWAFNPCRDAGRQFDRVERQQFSSLSQNSPLWGHYTRQLAVYRDTSEARATMSAYFHQSLGKCSAYARPGEPVTTRWEEQPTAGIEADHAIVAVGRPGEATAAGPLTHVVVAQRGRAVLVLSLEGEFAPSRLESVAREQRDDANTILGQLCGFTVDGCAGS